MDRRGGHVLALAAVVALSACGIGPFAATPPPEAVATAQVPIGTIPPRTTAIPQAALDLLREPWSGNNTEAEDFAKFVQELNAQNGVPARVHLDLLPSYTGTLIGPRLAEYRQSVEVAALAIVLDPPGLATWDSASAEARGKWLESTVHVLRIPPPEQVGASVHYPNAVVRVTVADGTGRVLGLGTYSAATGTLLALAK